MNWVVVSPQPALRMDVDAPDGMVWVCFACGKTSKNRVTDWTLGWDESCAFKAVLCHLPKEQVST